MYEMCFIVHPIGPPRLDFTSITATYILLSWSYSNDSVVEYSEVTWTEVDCTADNGQNSGWNSGIGKGKTSGDDRGSGASGRIYTNTYNMEGLTSNTSYSIVVAATNRAGSIMTQPVTVGTGNYPTQFV